MNEPSTGSQARTEGCFSSFVPGVREPEAGKAGGSIMIDFFDY